MKRDTGAVATFEYGTGTILAGQTAVTITHLVGSSPSCISVTPGLGCESPIEVLGSEVNATTFVVRFVGGVTLGFNASFLWGALK